MYRSSVFLYKGLYRPAPVSAEAAVVPVQTNRPLVYILPVLIAFQPGPPPVTPAAVPPAQTPTPLVWKAPAFTASVTPVAPIPAPDAAPLVPLRGPLAWLTPELLLPEARGAPLAFVAAPPVTYQPPLSWQTPHFVAQVVPVPPVPALEGAPPAALRAPLAWLPPRLVTPSARFVPFEVEPIPPVGPTRPLLWRPPMFRAFAGVPSAVTAPTPAPLIQWRQPLLWLPPHLVPWRPGVVLEDILWRSVGAIFIYETSFLPGRTVTLLATEPEADV